MNGHRHSAHGDRPLTRKAISATFHCLTGCAIGEVLGMVLSTWWGWGNVASIALSIALAFSFGYSLTIRPVLRAGLGVRRSVRVALAADTVSIAVMELVDNAFILAVPGAIAASLSDALFWWSLGLSLAITFVVTVPVNRVMIARGRGHAVVHAYHRSSEMLAADGGGALDRGSHEASGDPAGGDPTRGVSDVSREPAPSAPSVIHATDRPAGVEEARLGMRG